MKLCECGCGRETSLVRKADNRAGLLYGDYRHFVWGHGPRTGKSKTYPKRGAHQQSRDIHRLRAERALGKPLPHGAHVHHADGSKRADAPLVICQDQAYHALLHRRQRILSLGGDPNRDRWCGRCQTMKARSAFNRDHRKSDGLSVMCRMCQQAKWRQYRPRKAS